MKIIVSKARDKVQEHRARQSRARQSREVRSAGMRHVRVKKSKNQRILLYRLQASGKNEEDRLFVTQKGSDIFCIFEAWVALDGV